MGAEHEVRVGWLGASDGPTEPDWPPSQENRGLAWVVAILVLVTVGSLVAGTTLIGSSHVLTSDVYERQSWLRTAADAGLERARSELRADPGILPASGYVVLEDGVPVTDGAGRPVRGLRRWVYVGATAGDVFDGAEGSIVSLVEDGGGERLARELRVHRESFASYAVFNGGEGGVTTFGGETRIFGPVHGNGAIEVEPGARFHGRVRAAGAISTAPDGTFLRGAEEHVEPVALPGAEALEDLKRLAQAGGMSFRGGTGDPPGRASTRIEFVSIDLDGDGDDRGPDEGFVRVYRSESAEWVTGVTDPASSEQCGDFHDGRFVPTKRHPRAGHTSVQALLDPSARCFLGGHDSIHGGFRAADAHGAWVPNPEPHPVVEATGRPDAGYLFPISRSLNPDFRGVVHVDGSVVVSGRLRGRVTLAATREIVFGDDLTYATDPAAATCEDLAGFVAGADALVADNALNVPQDVTGRYRTLDDTANEFLHGSILTLGVFAAPGAARGPTGAEPCEGAPAGRGCLYLTGGIVQSAQGRVGGPRGTGYAERYAYDPCGTSAPPPHFPSTGSLARGLYRQLDPGSFEAEAHFADRTR